MGWERGSAKRKGGVITKASETRQTALVKLLAQPSASAMQAAQQQELEAMTDMFNKCVPAPSLAAR